MARRLPRGRTMGYGCPPPLAGGGVGPGNADTRVITALLTTATEGGKGRSDEGREVWCRGEERRLYTHTCTSLRPFLHHMGEGEELMIDDWTQREGRRDRF